jgi:tetratricopeptide (TPR) repeat protein
VFFKKGSLKMSCHMQFLLKFQVPIILVAEKMMLAQDQIIQPFYANDGNIPLLLDFARQAVLQLEPGFEPPEDLLDKQLDEAPYSFDRITTRYGHRTLGFETVHYQGYEPKYGGQAVDEVRVTAYGLPNGMLFEINCIRSWSNPRFLKLSVTGPENAVQTILEMFIKKFSIHSLSDSQLESALTSLKFAVRRNVWDAAILWGEYILEHHPDEAQALFALGVAYGAKKDYLRAEDFLLKALEIAPDHYDACYNLGVLYLQTNQPKKAVKALRRSLDIQPGNHPVFFQLGLALEETGDIHGAMQAYQDTIRTSPNPGGHWGYTGMDFTQQAEKALARLEKHSTSGN